MPKQPTSGPLLLMYVTFQIYLAACARSVRFIQFAHRGTHFSAHAREPERRVQLVVDLRIQEEERGIYQGFGDLKKATTVSHKVSCWRCFWNMGVSFVTDHLVAVLQEWVSIWLCQGCPLLQILYINFMDRIAWRVSSLLGRGLQFCFFQRIWSSRPHWAESWSMHRGVPQPRNDNCDLWVSDHGP